MVRSLVVAGGRAEMVQVDLADVDRLRGLVDEVAETVGDIDILVNNAANRPNSKISEITVAEWDWVFAVNLRAPFFLSQAVLPAMVRNRWKRPVDDE